MYILRLVLTYNSRTSAAYVEMMVRSSVGELTDEDRPRSPNPFDRSLSKRHWEALVLSWRNSIKDLVANRPAIQ